METKIKVLIVDDSALMRREIRKILEEDSNIEVVAAARNGQEGLELTKKLEPDVVTLDINMPIMDGLTALQYIMMESPRPVIMLSSLTQDGAVTSFEALELGAVDFVGKPGGTVSLNISDVTKDLIDKVKAAAAMNVTAAAAARKRKKQHSQAIARATQVANVNRQKTTPKSGSSDKGKIVVIGQSTGGPNTIMEILPHIPQDFP